MPEPRHADTRGGAPEPEAISLRGVAVAAGTILGGIIITLVAAWLLLHAWSRDRAGGTAPAPGDPPRIAAGARLEVDPAGDIAAYRSEKRKLLESYGWVDREHGIVRIPIERAMQALASGHGELPR